MHNLSISYNLKSTSTLHNYIATKPKFTFTISQCRYCVDIIYISLMGKMNQEIPIKDVHSLTFILHVASLTSKLIVDWLHLIEVGVLTLRVHV